jgi:hypothetical protein
MNYRSEATSVEGFVQQLVSNYLASGYWFYVTGRVPEPKDPRAVDRKLIERYGIDLSRPSRSRRKAAGLANLHLIRFQRFFVLVATHGRHAFFEDEVSSIRDVRKVPLQFQGYSIAVKRGEYLPKAEGEDSATVDGRYRVRVQIARAQYREFKAYLLERARYPAEVLGRDFFTLPFEPYAPIRKQLLTILGAVNIARKSAGERPLPYSVLRFRRRIVRPFEPVSFDGATDPEEAPLSAA